LFLWLRGDVRVANWRKARVSCVRASFAHIERQALSEPYAPGDILSQNQWCDSSAHCSRHGRSLPHGPAFASGALALFRVQEARTSIQRHDAAHDVLQVKPFSRRGLSGFAKRRLFNLQLKKRGGRK
jgi:hypothetical protein